MGDDNLKAFQLNQLENYFMNEDYETIYLATSKDFQHQFELNTFINVCSSFKQGITNLEKISEKDWFGTTQVVWMDENKEKTIFLAYDQNQGIIGFYLKPFVTYPTDQQWTKNNYRMPICDEWFVYWGGTNEFENYHYAYENQRYAYDLVQVKNGKTYHGTNLINENYYAFGTNVVAPFYGKVVKVVDGLKDNIPGEMDGKNSAGNYVIILHPNKEYSMIAHFKKDSIVVKKGETVNEGQLIGQCGNSGNSSEPHIHFQVMDDPSLNLGKSIRIQFQDQSEPVQGDRVKPLPYHSNKIDT